MGNEQMGEAPRKGRIKDARGRSVRQLDPVALQAMRRHELIDRACLARIVNEKGVGMSWWDRAPIIMAVVVLTGVGVTLFVKHQAGTPWGQLLRRSLPMFYLFILPFIVWGGARKKRFGLIRGAMLRHSRCPHCGYDVRGLEADPDDGATVCPECGCAWVLDL
jgi:hypothetical protein